MSDATLHEAIVKALGSGGTTCAQATRVEKAVLKWCVERLLVDQSHETSAEILNKLRRSA